MYYGMAIQVARAKDLSLRELDHLSRSVFEKAFSLSLQEVDDWMDIARGCLHTEMGQGYIKSGARILEAATNK